MKTRYKKTVSIKQAISDHKKLIKDSKIKTKLPGIGKLLKLKLNLN